MTHITIIGGGLAGLSAAHYLHRWASHLRIVLLEASPRLGGKVRTVREDGFVVEAGPDAVVRYKPAATRLMQELGLGDRIVGTQPASPSALIYQGASLRPIPSGLHTVIPSDLEALALSNLISPAGTLRAAQDLGSPKGPEGDEPFGAFVTRRLGQEVWERLVAPLTGGVYGGDPYQLSTLAAFPQLKALEQQYGSLIRGALAEREERGSREGGSLFASLVGGLGELVDGLVAQLKQVQIELNRPVQKLVQRGEGWRIWLEGGHLDTDALILATPALAASGLLRDIAPQAAAALGDISYGDSATVSLAFPAEDFPKTIGHGLLIAPTEGLSARGITWTSHKWAGRAPEGTRLVRVYFSGVDANQAVLEQLALKDLHSVIGPTPEPLRRWVFRFKGGLPQYTVGHLQRAAAALSAEQPGLYLAGAAFKGVGLPEVIQSGEGAAQKLVQHLQFPILR
jgi:oxygen-dependent protoporphyrinogen oxidase